MLDAWLERVKGWGAPEGDVDNRYNAENKLDAMLTQTEASKYLNPFYVARMRDRANAAAAAFAAQSILQGNPGTVYQEGTGAKMSLSRFMQDLLLRNADKGILNTGAGFGPIHSGNNVISEALNILRAGLNKQSYAGSAYGIPMDAKKAEETFTTTNSSIPLVEALLTGASSGGYGGPFGDIYGDQLRAEMHAQRSGQTNPAVDDYWNRLFRLARAAGYSI